MRYFYLKFLSKLLGNFVKIWISNYCVDYLNNIFYNNTIMHKKMILVVLFFLVLLLATFAETDDLDDFNLDSYIQNNEDQIGDYDPYGHTINETKPLDSDGLFKTKGISSELDVEVGKMKDIVKMSIAFFAVLILIAILVSLKKFSGIFLVIVMVVIVFVVAILVGVVFTNQNLITHAMYNNDASKWGNITINDFVVSKTSMKGTVYNHDDTLAELQNMIDFSDDAFSDSIVNEKHYIIENSGNKQETIIIEFVDNKELRAFLNSAFTPLRKFSVQKEEVLWGKLDSPVEEYATSYVMEENNFLFLMFGSNELTTATASEIINSYPSVYRYTNDINPPTIKLLQPDSLYTSKNLVSLEVIDKESGLNVNEISVFGIAGKLKSDFACERQEASYDYFVCDLKQSLREGENSIIISATDRNNNNVKKELTLYLDTQKPIIKLYENELVDELVFDVTDNLPITGDQIQLRFNNKEKVLGSRCVLRDSSSKDAAKFLLCRIDVASFSSQGKTNIDIIAIDSAGNSARKKIQTIIDTIPPFIEQLTTTSEVYVKDETFEFFLIDSESGIDASSISLKLNNKQERKTCPKLSNSKYFCRVALNPGDNVFDISVSDVKGNFLTTSFTVKQDAKPPQIELLDSVAQVNGSIRFRIWDDVSGINLNEISINGNYFEVLDICEPVSTYYYCKYSLDLSSKLAIISVSDNANNLGVSRIVLT